MATNKENQSSKANAYRSSSLVPHPSNETESYPYRPSIK
jgi:hypothetical protein